MKTTNDVPCIITSYTKNINNQTQSMLLKHPINPIRWLRHLYRYEEENSTIKVTFSKPKGMRKMVVQTGNLKTIGVTNQGAIVSNRSRGQKLTGMTLACYRLLCLRRRFHTYSFSPLLISLQIYHSNLGLPSSYISSFKNDVYVLEKSSLYSNFCHKNKHCH